MRISWYRMRRRHVGSDQFALLIGIDFIAAGVWISWMTLRTGPVGHPSHGNLPGVDFLDWVFFDLALVSLGVD